MVSAIASLNVLVLDGIDALNNSVRFRIRCHDLYGPLPDAVIEDTGYRYPVLERIENAGAKLIAMIRVRQDLAGIFPGCKFLLPTSTDKGALVGIRHRGRTVLAGAASQWEAYHELIKRAVEHIF